MADYVMVKVRLEQFALEIVKKLYAWGAKLFRVVEQVESNTYLVGLPPNSETSHLTFPIW